MERLTERHYNGNGYYMVCSCGPHCGSHCEDCDELDKLVDRLAYYEDMEEQGRLVVLPCKMGDMLWGTRWVYTGPQARQAPVIGMRFLDDMTLSITLGKVCTGEYGKKVFATLEELEQALCGGADH